MKSKGLIYTLIVTITICLGLFIYYGYIYRPLDAKKFIEQIREENKEGFDSLQKAFNYDDELNYRIRKSINEKDFKTAYMLMDSLPNFGKEIVILQYEGMILEKKGDYLNALKKFNLAISYDEYSLAIENRAELFIKMNRLNDAVNDYKIPFKWNTSYSLQIAKTFELMNKKDSALKYYQIYLEHYPADSFVKKRVSDLKK